MMDLLDKITDLPAPLVILILAGLTALYIFCIVVETKWG